MTDLWKPFEKADKLWEILRIALIDIKLAEKRSDTCVVMSIWYQKATPTLNTVYQLREREWEGCYVCLAGSVLLRRKPETVSLENVDQPALRKLRALDLLRSGHIREALRTMRGRIAPRSVKDRKVPTYNEDKKAWHTEMKNILEFLKGKNI